MLGTIPASRLGLILPNQFDLLRSVIKRWFRKARAKVRQERNRFLDMEDRDTETLMGEIRRFLREYEFELTTLADDMRRIVDGLERNRNEAEGISSSAIQAVETLRSRLIREFGGRVEEIYHDVGSVIKHWQQSAERCKDALLKEAKPVGMDEKLRGLLG